MFIEKQHEKSKETMRKIQKLIRYRPMSGQGNMVFDGDSENERFLRSLSLV